jgi:hypothetical protein
MKIPLIAIAVAGAALSQTAWGAAKPINLVPNTANPSPDYFCTWNIQGYYSSYADHAAQLDAVQESQLFGKGANQDWLGQYPKVKHDLIFLMDEGWDLPKEDVTVVPGRFPSYATGSQPERFKALSDAIKGRGWRGLGLWMRADVKTPDFWTERLQWSNSSGVLYWKVDYGDREGDEQWRHDLTDLGRKLAPGLTIETAKASHSITWADTYRTYDVDGIVAIPQTLARVVGELQYKAEPPAKGLINCEDEMYMGAALGCCYGVMRHGFAGRLPSGRQDFVFPPVTRNLKLRLDEVTRAVRWHRIAPAFAVGANPTLTSKENFTDNWHFLKDESWEVSQGNERTMSAPATVARGLPLPTISLASGTVKPYVIASRNPNGAVSVATLGRTLSHGAEDRQWITGENADVSLEVGANTGPIGIFGRYHTLTLVFDKSMRGRKILAQDLAGDTAKDITRQVRITDKQIVIPGELIDRVGLSAATPGDKSEPGLVLVVR